MFAGEEEDIVKWVKWQLQRGQISELLEPGLLELDPESTEWEEFLLGVKVGLLCTAPDLLDRPSMADIVYMLEGCRVGPDVPSSADKVSKCQSLDLFDLGSNSFSGSVPFDLLGFQNLCYFNGFIRKLLAGRNP